MLVIRRRAGESLVIGNRIRITLLETHGGTVKIGIEAPADVSVHRSEIVEEIERANRQAAETPPDPELIASFVATRQGTKGPRGKGAKGEQQDTLGPVCVPCPRPLDPSAPRSLSERTARPGLSRSRDLPETTS